MTNRVTKKQSISLCGYWHSTVNQGAKEANCNSFAFKENCHVSHFTQQLMSSAETELHLEPTSGLLFRGLKQHDIHTCSCSPH